MKITCLAENTTRRKLPTVHGLSLYIETEKHLLLFDIGPDGTAFANAETLGIDLRRVDTLIISHGHKDHGGALGRFLQENTSARVYVQREAFLPHFSRNYPDPAFIGLDVSLMDDPRVILLDGDAEIDEELLLFTVRENERYHSSANDVLFEGESPDSFRHEQDLLIRGRHSALIMGCGHNGIVSIMEKAAPYRPLVCVGGYHLFNPTTGATVPEWLLSSIASQLANYPDTQFYTCHCTGKTAFEYLASRLTNMSYLHCGDTITVDE